MYQSGPIFKDALFYLCDNDLFFPNNSYCIFFLLIKEIKHLYFPCEIEKTSYLICVFTINLRINSCLKNKNKILNIQGLGVLVESLIIKKMIT